MTTKFEGKWLFVIIFSPPFSLEGDTGTFYVFEGDKWQFVQPGQTLEGNFSFTDTEITFNSPVFENSNTAQYAIVEDTLFLGRTLRMPTGEFRKTESV